MADDDLPILFMVTAGGRDEAERLGEALVVEHLAGSCSVIPVVHSFYHSDGLLQRPTEALLLVRTVTSQRGPVMEYLNEHGPQERAEILEIKVAGGSVPYLEWLGARVGKPGSDR
ncbi:MAG TPA: divalent cation tolerance protein CutA [Candidatus Dormibacteraeota bacterium]|nr:divalent cation tolerance protein CutA [Candidatus Dormibacteraeota bacterium]